MERMTIRGDHGVYMAPGWDFRIDSDDYELVQKVLDRFAAYEDTCLAPEDITKPFGEETILKLAASVFGMAPDRLRELVKVSLFRGAIYPGATVYCLCEDLLCFYPKTDGWYVSEETVGAVGVGRFYVGEPSENTAFDVSDVGKIVFLTRQEAEAAVAKIATATEEGERPDSVEKGRNG